ncbi:MAG: DUF4286 family protein [Luteibaculum sp.]
MQQLIYNVTVNIDHDIHTEWVNWMKTVHIPDVMASKCFVESRFTQVQSNEEHGGVTYSIQYLAASQADLDRYQREFAPKLQKEHTERYKGKFAAFRTLLKMVAQY